MRDALLESEGSELILGPEKAVATTMAATQRLVEEKNNERVKHLPLTSWPGKLTDSGRCDGRSME